MRINKFFPRMLAFIIAVLFCISATSSSAVPSLINFQGVLKDSDGKAVAGSKSIVFDIYTKESGGSAVWSVTEVVSLDSKGLYSVMLDVSELDFDVQYWLGVDVAGDGEMTPRYKLACTGYAMNAKKLDGHAASYYLSWSNITNMPADVGAGESMLAVQLNDVNISSPTAAIDFNSSHFSVTKEGSYESDVSITTAPYALMAGTASYVSGNMDANTLDGLDSAAFQLALDTPAWKAADSAKLNGRAYTAYVSTDAINQVIGGTKTFVTHPKIAVYTAPIANEEYAPKQYVDDSAVAGAAVKSATNTFTGQNTFVNMVTVSSDVLVTGGLSVTGQGGYSIQTSSGIKVGGPINTGEDETGYDINFYGDTLGGRFLWDESKMALRAGIATGTHWDNGNVGSQSLATGSNCIAKGQFAVAMGQNSHALYPASFAVGGNACAVNNYAVAMGVNTVASGQQSFATGGATLAKGISSTAMGDSTVAGGDYSFAAGRKSSATARGAFAISDSVEAQFLVDTQDAFGARFQGGYSLTGGEVSISSNVVVNGKLTISEAAGYSGDIVVVSTGAVNLFRVNSSGDVYAHKAFHNTGADYAEWFEKEDSIAENDVVGLNILTGKARKYLRGDVVLGVCSSNPGFVGNRDINKNEEDMNSNHVLVGLMGQLDFNKEQVEIADGRVITKDGKQIGYLLSNGNVFLRINQ